MMYKEYKDAKVEEIGDGKWRVTLGAGILPQVVTVADIFNMRQTSGSTVWPGSSGLEELIRLSHCVYAVERYLDAQGKTIGIGVISKPK